MHAELVEVMREKYGNDDIGYRELIHMRCPGCDRTVKIVSIEFGLPVTPDQYSDARAVMDLRPCEPLKDELGEAKK